MKDLYSIGETAKLLGVSTQTLRFYDKEGLLKPSFIDEETGYRYYSYMQFHLIDRIKYLQGFGLSLEEIKPIILEGSVDLLLPQLTARKLSLLDEINRAADQIREIEWYIRYWGYLDTDGKESPFYRIRKEERFVLEVPCYETDELSDMEIRLAEKKSQELYRDLSYRRLYGYQLLLSDLEQGLFKPKTYFIYTRQRPSADYPDIHVLPAGEYVCFRTPILKQSWDSELLRRYFAEIPAKGPAVALEFEDNLHDWSEAMYEVQIMV